MQFTEGKKLCIFFSHPRIDLAKLCTDPAKAAKISPKYSLIFWYALMTFRCIHPRSDTPKHGHKRLPENGPARHKTSTSQNLYGAARLFNPAKHVMYAEDILGTTWALQLDQFGDTILDLANPSLTVQPTKVRDSS